MTMRQRRHLYGRQKHLFRFLDGPYVFMLGYWTAPVAASIRGNLWQLFKRRRHD